MSLDGSLTCRPVWLFGVRPEAAAVLILNCGFDRSEEQQADRSIPRFESCGGLDPCHSLERRSASRGPTSPHHRLTSRLPRQKRVCRKCCLPPPIRTLGLTHRSQSNLHRSERLHLRYKVLWANFPIVQQVLLIIKDGRRVCSGNSIFTMKANRLQLCS